MKKKKKNLLVQISTLPSPDSLKWAGQQRSLLSSILLWALWICRVLSLLQICKLLFRKIVTFLKRGTTDFNSKRVNVPPMFCELYFILWFVFLLLAYIFKLDVFVVRIFTYYYLFESIVWVLYYTVFRRFFEENYSIYHELEYLTVLIMVIPSQALGLANVYGLSFGEIVSGLLGASIDTTPVSVRILGAMFAAIVISMIISSFPTEKVKKKIEKPHMYVIGCGDVVKNRLYPALIRSGCSEKDVDVYDIDSQENNIPYCKYLPSSQAICEKIDNELDTHDIVWIETPSYTHVSYVDEFINSKSTLVVVEKPITVKKEEFEKINKIIKDESLRNKIFFLSYYLIEKALPLNFISSYNQKYEKYLDISDDYLIKNSKLFLGAVNKITVSIVEGVDSRDWVKSNKYGGQLLETFIHNVLIATLFADLPQNWQDVSLTKEGDKIELFAKDGKTDISLIQVKNAKKEDSKRYARIDFANGYIYADFDSESAEIYFASLDKKCTVKVKDIYKDKYAVIVDMVKRVEKGESKSYELDGLKNQLDVTNWLLNL